VVFQPEFDDPRYGGLNPYAIGFAMMQDIERICVAPAEEDRIWFPDIAGCGDPYGVLRDVWANYRDESFVSQFLSPRLIREWRLFQLSDAEADPELEISAIHDERGYRRIRRALARQYDVAWLDPDIQVVDVNLSGDRRLLLQHNIHNGVLLDPGETGPVMQHLADLWGYDVLLKEIEPASGKVVKEYAASARPTFF
jgi:spore cortex formation protein SpoVR/YcgB (stage V sporulation)